MSIVSNELGSESRKTIFINSKTKKELLEGRGLPSVQVKDPIFLSNEKGKKEEFKVKSISMEGRLYTVEVE